jgi:hypothetical protein
MRKTYSQNLLVQKAMEAKYLNLSHVSILRSAIFTETEPRIKIWSTLQQSLLL